MVCAFTSAKILGRAISKLLQLYQAEKEADVEASSEEGEEEEMECALALARARQQALFDYLTTVELKASSYERLRRQSNADISDLASDYLKHRKRKLEVSESAPSSRKAAKSAGSSSDAQEVRSSCLSPSNSHPRPLPLPSPLPSPSP